MFRFYFPLFMVLLCDIYTRHFEYSCVQCFVICSTENNLCSDQIEKETTNNQQNKSNSVKHVHRQQFSKSITEYIVFFATFSLYLWSENVKTF